MKSDSYEEWKSELEVLRNRRDISPSTRYLLDAMIKDFKELENAENEEVISNKHTEILHLESIIDARLEKDSNTEEF